MSKVLVPLAEGFEEIEAVAIVDLLRRAGIEVRTASLTGREVTGSHGITVLADAQLDDLETGDYDMIVLPGCQRRSNSDPLCGRVAEVKLTHLGP